MLPLIALLGGLITFYIINAMIAGLRYARPARIRISFANPGDRDLAYEAVQISSSDGAKLAGWYIPSQNRAAVILLHGYSGNRLGVMFHAETLAQNGFGVLLFDLRAHGDSGGTGTFARGESMIADLAAALAFVQHRPDVDGQRIGVMGVSVGGTMALQGAARLKGLAAAASDGAGPAAYADLEPPQNVSSRLFAPINRLFFHMANRAAPSKPLPPNKSIVAQIAPRPVLFIAAGRGGEAHLSRQYYAAAHEPKELWEIGDAPHAGGWHKHPDTYARTLVDFFQRHLLA
ncbi:MAG: alpha/beta fold hydrolase [Ardenticatenaceae bacterium]|nr:alpha/beta fold hydrolase [Anaerolineales bacterium]MCB8918398.1 alpha/beta fold hydrolase [Ardenticatenaceae bacterium]